MATGRPAGAVLQPSAMILAASYDFTVTHHARNPVDDEPSRVLQVTAQTKVGITRNQHFLIHGAVRVVASGAAFHHGIVLEEEWPLLRRMALGAGLVRRLQFSSTAVDDVTFMRVVAIVAGHLTTQDRMRMREAKLTSFIQMASKAGLRRLIRINNRGLGAAGLHVQRAPAVAGLATNIDPLCVLQRDSAMCSSFKMAGLLFMTLLAFFRANKSCSGNIRWCHHGAVGDYAANQEKPPNGGSSEN